MDADFSNRIIFNDEINFHLDELVNGKNFYFWVLANPQVIVENKMQPQCVSLWCEY